MKHALLITATLLTIPAAVQADVLHVPSEFSTIQAALNAASAGDEVELAAGVYHEAVNTNGKAVVLRSADPLDPDVVAATVLDGTGVDDALISINTNEWLDTVIEGLTLRDGVGALVDDHRHGGAIYLDNSSPTIRHCVFENNSAHFGGAISSYFSWAILSDCRFDGNEAYGMNWRGGGAIGVYKGYLKVVNSTFTNNLASIASQGGAISLTYAWFSSIVGCVFADNEAMNGGAIKITHSDCEIANCTITDNVARSAGGALYLIGNTGTLVTNTIVWNNTDTDGAGDVEIIAPATLLVDASLFDTDPRFVDAAAGDYHLAADSPARQEGLIWLLPPDFADIDSDGDEWEAVPFDLEGNIRAAGGPEQDASMDLGAYEAPADAAPETCATDLNQDGLTNFDDLLILLAAWQSSDPDSPADIDENGTVEMADLLLLLTSWGAC